MKEILFALRLNELSDRPSISSFNFAHSFLASLLNFRLSCFSKLV